MCVREHDRRKAERSSHNKTRSTIYFEVAFFSLLYPFSFYISLPSLVIRRIIQVYVYTSSLFYRSILTCTCLLSRKRYFVLLYILCESNWLDLARMCFQTVSSKSLPLYSISEGYGWSWSVILLWKESNITAFLDISEHFPCEQADYIIYLYRVLPVWTAVLNVNTTASVTVLSGTAVSQLL